MEKQKIDAFGYPVNDISSDLSQTVVDTFSWDYDKDHNPRPVKSGKKDIQAFSQSFEESTDFKPLLKQAMATGDMSLLQQRQGVYMDNRDLPKDIFDAKEKAAPLGDHLIDAATFDKLVKDYINSQLEKRSSALKEFKEEVKEVKENE